MVIDAGHGTCDCLVVLCPWSQENVGRLTSWLSPSQPVDDDRAITKMVDDILTELGHTESRAAKMDIDDLLK